MQDCLLLSSPLPQYGLSKKAAFLHTQATLLAVRNNVTSFWIAVTHCWHDIFLKTGNAEAKLGGGVGEVDQ